MSQTWDATLRASGYRVTPQRQLVLEAVTRLHHAWPEEICSEVNQTARGVNLSTVYRTLELLEQLGLVSGDLYWTFDMAAVGKEIQNHLAAQLKRVK